ncbi:putative phage holin [Kitasatospora cineracea]
MVELDAAQWANVSASGLVAVSSASAAVMYHVRAPWRRSRIGRHIMAVTVSVGLLGLYTVLITLVWPSGPAAAVLRVSRCVLLVVMAGLMVQRVRLVVDAQRELPKESP